MSVQKLRMKYHPAKKEVAFQRFENGREIPIKKDSDLKKIENKRGQFVLQDCGNSFFETIAVAFDGIKELDIEVVTTKLDFEDFVSMAEYYNENGKCKMNPTLLAELPDMKETYREVVKHGEESIGILRARQQGLFENLSGNENVKKSAEGFAQQIGEEIEKIKEKINDLGDNHVSLCFTGVYSAGKSALINAMLGYRILPEDISSETAKMFRISGPAEGEATRIEFDIMGTQAEIRWNEEKACFEFVKGPSENPVRKGIQESVLNKNKKLKQHEQIQNILKDLNGRSEVSPSIKVAFPIPLDTERVQFVIYDTPGTDSNYLDHKKVLEEALAKQSQSILIFVAKPDGLEGAGNNALLNYLKTAEEKNSKTSIDISRSLFVINKADTVQKDKRKTLQDQEIKSEEDSSLSIILKDKKLFFASALYAYAARAVKNKIATEDEDWLLTGNINALAGENSPFRFCYEQNRCATSEKATELMLKKCKEELDRAKEENDAVKILEVCSGIYALETEISQYGEKYASAVKAFAIIDSVDKVLNNLSGSAKSLEDSSQREVEKIDRDIHALEETINAAINEEYFKAALPSKTKLPEEMRKKLKVDADALRQTHLEVREYLGKGMKKRFLGLGKVKFRPKDKEDIKRKIEASVNDFTDQFLNARTEMLKGCRDSFMSAVQKAIEDNGDITDEAKKVFQDIPKPQIQKPGEKEIAAMGDIYDSRKRVDKVLWMKQENLDEKGFWEDIDRNFIDMETKMADDYSEDYAKALDTLLLQIQSIYKTNLMRYSVQMKAMAEDKEAMMRLCGKLKEASAALGECQQQLNETIWKEVSHA